MTTAPPQTSPQIRARLRTKLILALSVALVGLVCCEIVARLALGGRFIFGAHTGPPMMLVGSFDPYYGWANRPNSEAWIVARRFDYDFDYRVEINSDGMRSPTIDRQHEPGKFRILLLGDSVTWGWGVDQEEMYAAVLSRKLGPGVEVVNPSVPGWGTDQELMWLEREGAGWAPDLVVLSFIYNDIRSNSRANLDGLDKPHFVIGQDGELALEEIAGPREGSPLNREFKRWRRQLAPYSAILRWSVLSDEDIINSRPPLIRLVDEAELESVSPEQQQIQAHLSWYLEQITNPKAVTHRLLGRMRSTCESLGVPLLVFSIPHHHDQYLYDPGYSVPDVDPGEPFLTPVSRCLQQAGQVLGFRTLSVDQRFLEEARLGRSLDCGDGHLNARGNELVAECLIPEITAYSNGEK